MNRAISWATLVKGARLAAAFAVTAGAFLATRQLFHGWCLLPDAPWEGYDWNYPQVERLLFYLLPIVFLLGFLWLMWEFAYPILVAGGTDKTRAPRLAIAVALAIYVGVGFLGCTATSQHGQSDWGGRDDIIVWAFWDVGFLVRTGNFSPVDCGY